MQWGQPLKRSPRLADAVGGVSGEERRSLPPDQFGRDAPLATSPQRAARRADAVGGCRGRSGARSPLTKSDETHRSRPAPSALHAAPMRWGGVGGGPTPAPP